MERSTKQRESIRRVILDADRPLAPKEILELAHEDEAPMSLATIYRNIRAMAERGEITPVDLPGEPTRYEPAGKAHHHHFHCRTCGRAFDIPGCPLDHHNLAPPEYVVEGHELTLTGLCPACAG